MDPQTSNIVTLVKAVGITLMVFAHALPSDSIVWRVIYTFHMPLFFLMSGYCFKEKYLDDTKQYFIRKIKGIYVPFVLFSMVFLLLHNLFCSWYIYEPEALYDWRAYIWNATRIVTRMSHNEGMLGTFWFLKQLFWGSMIFFFTLKLCNRKVWRTTLILFLLTEILCITHIRVPYWGIDYNTTYAAFFLSTGLAWRQLNVKINNCILFVVGSSLIVVEILVLHKVSFLNNTPITLLIYTLPAIFGTVMVFELCGSMLKHIRGKFLSVTLYIGQHTLSIMALHFISFKLVSSLYISLHSLPIVRLVEFPVLNDASNILRGGYTLIGVVLPLLLVLLWSYVKQLYTKVISSYGNK